MAEIDPFDAFAETLSGAGIAAAFKLLEDTFKDRGDIHRVFETNLMRARHDIGLPLIQLGPSSDWPEAIRTAYEDKVIAACRDASRLFLDAGDIPSAFQYSNMIGELEPIREAIEQFRPTEDNGADKVIEIAIGYGVHPEKGLAMVLDRYGMCQAITSCEQLLHQGARENVRQACVRMLARAVHRELAGRLASEIESREDVAPPAASVSLLLKGRDWLFENENYHIDTSHLNAIVRMARLLPRCDELYLILQCCEYGSKLSERFRYPEPPPFENVYEDSAIYFRTILGQDVEKGLEHFRKKAEQYEVAEGAAALEVYVNLLGRAGKADEALAYASRKLSQAGPSLQASVSELCQSKEKFKELAEIGRRREDLLTYAAGLIQLEATKAR